MELLSINSPGPLSGVSGVAMDGDSQETTTLGDALTPMPDTQPDSQSGSQEHQSVYFEETNTSVEAPAPAKLFRRPSQPSVDDIGATFSYAKRPPIKPGRFSDRPTTKPSADNSDPQLSELSPSDGTAILQGPLAIPPRERSEIVHAVSPHEVEFVQNHRPPQAIRRTVPSLQIPQTIFSPAAALHGLPARTQPFTAEPVDAPQEKNQNHQASRTVEKAPLRLHAPSPHTNHLVHTPQSERLMQSQYRLHMAQNNLAQPVRESLRPKKQRPFEDHDPACPIPSPQKQTSTPVTSLISRIPVMESRPVCQMGFDQDVADNHSPQHQSKSSVPPQFQQKSRKSLQNDISVSSAQPSRHIRSLSPVNMVSRPKQKDRHRPLFRKNTPTERPQRGSSIIRSNIARSNSKAKRSALSQTASSSPSSSTFSFRTSQSKQTTSMRGSSDSLPQGVLKQHFEAKFTTAAAAISGVLNSNFTPLMEEVNEHLSTIEDLGHQLKEQKHKLSRYREQVQGKDDKLGQLEGERELLLAEVQSKDQELQKTTAKIARLDGKCHQYKEYLNEAIAEQQKLYKATRAKCDQAVALIQTEEKKRNSLLDIERKNAEDVREKLMESVKSTVSEYKQKEREFHDKIEALNQKVQERDADIVRERETAQSLLHQNGSINHMQSTLNSFEAQMKEVIDKVNAVVVSQHQRGDDSAKETNSKLDQMMQCLLALDERTLPSGEMTNKMQELNAQTVTSILNKLEPILAIQVETKASLDALTLEIARSVDDLWEELEDRQSVIEEYADQRIAEREESIGLLQQHVRVIETELAHQNQLFFSSEETLRKRQDDIEALNLDIANLIQEKAQIAPQFEHLEQLRKECAKLKDDSITQGSLVAELQGKLQESTAKLTTEEEKHQKDVEELRKLLEQQVTEAKAAQMQAVEAAQQEAMVKMNAIKGEIDTQLNRALEERAVLQLELDAAKEQVTLIEAEGTKASEKAITLEKELQASRAEGVKNREETSLEDVEQQAAKEQQLQAIEDLTARLEKSEASFQKLVGNAKAYDRAAQTVVFSLRQWTRDYGTIETMANDLRRSKETNGVLGNLDVRFKPLVEMQLLNIAVAQYCRSQKEAIQQLSGRTAVQSGPGLPPTFEAAAGSVLARRTRVTIKSPASNASSPQPPSVQIEQKRRRLGEQPKSILKFSVSSQQSESDELGEEAPRAYASMSRGPYNRLVAGSSGGSSTITGHVSSQKRKLSLDQEMGRKRAKGPEGIKPFAFSSPPEQTGGSDTENVPDAPRKAFSFRPSVMGSTTNDEQDISLVRPSQASQKESHIDMKLLPFEKQAFMSDGSDPLAIFFKRRYGSRGNAESQQSELPSQEVGGPDTSQQSSHAADESQRSDVHSQDFGDRDHCLPT